MRLLKIIIFGALYINFSVTYAYEIRDDRNKLYLGINAGSYQEVLDEGAIGGSFQFGYDLHKFFAVESQLGLTYKSLDESDGVISASLDALLSYASIYIRGNIPFDYVTVFAMAGYTYLRRDYKSELTAPSLNLSESDNYSDTIDDISYGAGIDLYGNQTTAFSIKWIRIIDIRDGNESVDLDAYLIGFTHYLK